MKKSFLFFAVVLCLFSLCLAGAKHVKAAEKNEFPFVSVESYSVSKDKIIPGSDVTLTLKLKNNSETTPARNVVVGVMCPAGVSPKYGTASQAYLKEIEKGDIVEISFEFATLEEIYSYYLDFEITIFCDESNNNVVLRIPVGTDSPFSITNVSVDENGIEGGVASASVSFKVIGIDYVKNVVLTVYYDEIEANAVSIGALSPGTSKSQLISVPLLSYGEHKISFAFSYEDSTGKTGEMRIDSKPISVDKRIVEPTRAPEENLTGILDRLKSNTKMLTGVAGVIGVLGLSVVVFLIGKRRKR